eukprot:CAMPEP_0113542804 /NCGR_PEP_ID=MMETSP0015_2-20120614/9813_1 /TAXON_ID=2838 /ORGANISM="Odontella" /LENGTH=616 /DNA_ID=CAMNT_0000442907 /DNA_START=100 /DNA_END=1950 /DNA_ORIENTATION=- /assembly_acc=CAM_ASM_000160
MPELPEVEWFRRVLLSLVDEQGRNPPLAFELHGEKPPRKWVAAEDVKSNTGKWRCTDVLRKGKQLCMVLEKDAGRGKTTTTEKDKEVCYFYLHMGMTGRLVSPTKSCTWGHKYVSDSPDAGEGEESWPPRFTYLVLTSGAATVAFADPRKFGGCYFEFDGGGDGDSDDEIDGDGGVPSSSPSPSLLDGLAPDALADTATLEQRTLMAAALTGQRLGVKALILDQKRVVSGVGNWVADEVLYGCEIHPDQSYLTEEEALAMVEGLRSVVTIAVDCLDRGVPYPDEWLFGYRWTKKKAGKDHVGRNLSFLTSGGRTSAIVASLQKLRKTHVKKAEALTANNKTKVKGHGRAGEEEAASTTSSPEAKDKGIKEENFAPTRKRKRKQKAVSSEAEQEGVVKRKKTNPSSSTNNKQQLKKESLKEESSLSGKQKKEDSLTASISSRDTDKGEELVEDASFPHEKEATLERIDKSVRSDFRRVGFAKWQKDWLPVIQLGPYDVPPGLVRDSWMKLYQKNMKTKKPKRMQKRLVYWYGCDRHDLSAAFSFVTEGSVIGYEEGVERGIFDGFFSKIQKKVDRSVKLTTKEKLLVEGLKEVKDESALSRMERVAWLKVEETHADR